MARRITSLDVAKLVGVSVAAVSRAFTPGASISERTKSRVLEAATALGYQPNQIARSLTQRRSNLVAVLMSGWNNFGYVDMLRRLSEQIEARGYEIILKSMLDHERIGQHIREGLRFQVAAIVVVSEVVPAPYVAECEARGVPVLLVNRGAHVASTSAVSLDGVHLGHQVTDYLLACGHRRIALLRGRPDIDFTTDVMNTITDRISRTDSCKLTANLVNVLGYEAGRRAIGELFAVGEPPDAVFCTYDDTAIGVMDGARFDLRLKVPDQLAVIGNGNRAVSSWASHELTTVGYPCDEIVDNCMRILMAQLENSDRPHEVVLIRPDLVIRGSSRPLSPGL